MKPWRWSLLVTALVLAPAIGDAEPAASPGADLSVTRGDLQERLLLTGALDAVSAENLTVPRTPLWLLQLQWLEVEGTQVHAGQKVAEFDNSAFTAALNEKRLAALQAADDLAKLRAQNELTTNDKAAEVDKAKAELDKARLTAALPRGSLPERDWQENQLDMQRKEVAYAKAKDDLDSQRKSAAFDADVKQIALDKSRREIKEAEKATQDMELTAPRDGIVVVGDIPWLRRKIEVGDTLDQGFTVVSLPDLGTMRVKALLSDVDDGRVAVGMKATCTIDAFSDHPIEGVVREVSPAARETSQNSDRRAFDVIVELPEIDRERMLPGLSVKVEIHGREVHDATLVPRRAIDFDAKPAQVRSVDGRTSPVDVAFCDAQVCALRADANAAPLQTGLHLRPAGETP
ncbi:MAG TPA: HlyD family efflux transporter periplasmic adaptor subunit [Polyangiaceae bacterium]